MMGSTNLVSVHTTYTYVLRNPFETTGSWSRAIWAQVSLAMAVRHSIPPRSLYFPEDFGINSMTHHTVYDIGDLKGDSYGIVHEAELLI